MNYESSINKDNGLEGPVFEKEKKSRNWLIAIVGLIFLFAALGAAYFFMNQPKTAADKAKAATGANGKAEQAQTVTVIAPGTETVVRTINATGTLAARYEVPIGVVGEGGQVARVYVDAGSWVSRGQVLVSIDRSVQTQQVAGLEAQIGVARADLQLAQNELDRALKLVDRGFISKADVDRRMANRDSARARVNVAEAQIRELRARNARLDIRAPSSGYILERNVEQGQTVGQGSGVLFRMAQGGEMELQALLSESDLANISVGIPASATPVGTDQVFEGRIWQISPVINPQTRQGIAKIALTFDRSLRPGGFANVAIKAGAITAPVLPESAIQNDKEGSFVYTVDATNKVSRRAVKIGEVTANGIAIIEGLSGTERVVLYAGGFLNPGETITPKLQTAAKSSE